MAVFWFAQGCACSPEQFQPLCAQHAIRATPRGSMEMVQDLTVDAEFTAVWTGIPVGQCRPVGVPPRF